MPGLYSHTTRANGLTLTAAIYNADHENHITNAIPTMHDDYSANAGEMQTTTDPGEIGTESLATSTAGELERLRFAILEIKQKIDGTLTQWYQTPFSSAVLDKSGRPALPPWYIAGCEMVIPPSSPKLVLVVSGICRSADDQINLVVSSSIYKSVSSLWVTDANAGGCGVTWTTKFQTFHTFLFKTAASTYDIGFDSALTASNLMARASATHFRRIGSFPTPSEAPGSSGNFHIWQDEKDWYLIQFSQFFQNASYYVTVAPATSPGSAANAFPLPSGIKVKADVWFGFPVGAGDAKSFQVGHYNVVSFVGGVQEVRPIYLASQGFGPAGAAQLWTDTNRSIKFAVTQGTGGQTINMIAVGWHDQLKS